MYRDATQQVIRRAQAAHGTAGVKLPTTARQRSQASRCYGDHLRVEPPAGVDAPALAEIV
jgi:hypothetical protein